MHSLMYLCQDGRHQKERQKTQLGKQNLVLALAQRCWIPNPNLLLGHSPPLHQPAGHYPYDAAKPSQG